MIWFGTAKILMVLNGMNDLLMIMLMLTLINYCRIMVLIHVGGIHIFVTRPRWCCCVFVEADCEELGDGGEQVQKVFSPQPAIQSDIGQVWN